MPLRVAAVAGALLLAVGALVAVRRAPAVPAPVLPTASESPWIGAAELKSRLETGEDLLLVFVGTEIYFGERRIPGARCVEYGDLAAFAAGLERHRPIVLYCGCCAGAAEGVSGMALRRLRELGFTRVRHLEGHFEAWRRAGYPVEGTRPDPPEERAYADEGQRRQLEAFEAEVARRRGELQRAVEREEDAARSGELRSRLDELDREDEIRGLRLKRRLAEEAGDPAKAAELDRLIRHKTEERP